MLKPSDYTSIRTKRMRRRALIRKIRPYILLVTVVLVTFILARTTVKQTPCITEIYPTPTLIVETDNRIAQLSDFLEKKQSPLASYSKYLIEVADKYGLDWTLMPAISGMESNFGKAMPKETNDPFGIERGGHSVSFPTLYSAIDFEGKLLSGSYKLIANRAIGHVYCPEQTCTQNWANIVTNFSKEIAN